MEREEGNHIRGEHADYIKEVRPGVRSVDSEVEDD